MRHRGERRHVGQQAILRGGHEAPRPVRRPVPRWAPRGGSESVRILSWWSLRTCVDELTRYDATRQDQVAGPSSTLGDIMPWDKVPAKTADVLQVLKTAAREMRTVTYAELAQRTGLAQPGVGQPLGYIRDEVCRARDLPWLTALAVKKQTRLPGGSFFPDDAGMSADLESDDFRNWWQAMVMRVYAWDWSSVELCDRSHES